MAFLVGSIIGGVPTFLAQVSPPDPQPHAPAGIQADTPVYVQATTLCQTFFAAAFMVAGATVPSLAFSSDPVPQRIKRVQAQSEFALAGPSAPQFSSSSDLSVPLKPVARPQQFSGFAPADLTTLFVTFTQPPAPVAKPSSAAQQRFADLPLPATSSATSTTSEWMYQPFVVSFVRPLSAAQQQFTGGLAPQSPYAQTYSAASVLDSTIVVPLTVVVDDAFWAPFAPTTVASTTAWFYGQPPAIQIRPFAAAQQQFVGSGAPFSSNVATVSTWRHQQDPVKQVKPVSAAQQQFVGGWSPFSSTTATASTWRHQQDPVRFVKSIPAAQQPFVGGWAPFSSTTPSATAWFYGQPPVRHVRPLSAAQQQFVGWPPKATALTVSTTAWFYGQPPVKHIKPFPASQQRFSGFQPIGTIVGACGYSSASASALKKHRKFNPPPTSITIVYGLAIVNTPSDFWASQWPVAFRKRFPVTQQSFSGYSPRKPVLAAGTPSAGTRTTAIVKNRRFRAPPTSITVAYQGPVYASAATEAWMSQSPVRFAKRLPVALLPFSGFQPLGTIVALNTLGWAHQQPVALGKRVSPAQQRFGDFTPLGAITAPVTVGQYFQQPHVLGKRFPVGLQRFGDFQPQGAIVSVTPQGWMYQQPAAAVKPFPASLQRFGDFQPLDTIVVVTPQGWMYQQPERLKKPFATALQRFADFAPLDTIFVPTPDYQKTYAEYPVRFVKPLSPTLQQFAGFEPRGAIFSVTKQGWFGQAPIRLIKPYPVILQQFSTLTMRPYPSSVIGTPEGEMLKNEVTRVTWLQGSSVRVVYLKNEIIRITDLGG